MTSPETITPSTATETAAPARDEDPSIARSWPPGDLAPPERRALREIVEHGDLAIVDGQAYLVAPVSPATIDALAAFEAEAEDLEDEPIEDQGDDGPPMASTTWT